MITGTVLGGKQVADGLRARVPKVVSGVEKAVMRLTIKLQRAVITNKLQGQVLNVKTGRLQRSINQKVSSSGDRITGTVGTNVSYAKPHEFGFSGSVPVKEHLRLQTMAWGRPIDPRRVTVRAHNMHMHMPERSFLRSALADMRPEILEEIAKAVKQ